MQSMIPLTIDLSKVPDEERRVLCTEAVRRGVPVEVLIAEAMVRQARQLMQSPEKQD